MAPAGESAPTMTAQAPFFIVLNTGSGSRDTDTTRETVAGIMNAAGREHHLLLVRHSTQLQALSAQAVARAQAQGGIVVAAGGDGTLNAVAQAALGSGRPYGVIPRGTFNYFGRTHGIPLDVEAATRALLTGRIKPVQVGLANGRVFLVNASLGLYPQLLEDREAYKQQYGRKRVVAVWSGLATLLREHRQLRILIEHEGSTRSVRTPTLFVGNNRLQLEQVGVPEAGVLEHGQLAAIVLRPIGSLKMLWLMLRGALGRLGEEEDVIHFRFARLSVRPALPYGRRRMKLATDGEVAWEAAPIVFALAPQPLLLIVPQDAEPERG